MIDMNKIDSFEKKQIEKTIKKKSIPNFSYGDVLCVDTKVREGSRERIQQFEGVCITKKNRGINSSFSVRKISYGEGVERIFPLYSPNVLSVKVVRRNKVRRAKLYYLRNLRGKKARMSAKNEKPKNEDNTVVKKTAVKNTKGLNEDK